MTLLEPLNHPVIELFPYMSLRGEGTGVQRDRNTTRCHTAQQKQSQAGAEFLTSEPGPFRVRFLCLLFLSRAHNACPCP